MESRIDDECPLYSENVCWRFNTSKPECDKCDLSFKQKLEIMMNQRADELEPKTHCCECTRREGHNVHIQNCIETKCFDRDSIGKATKNVSQEPDQGTTLICRNGTFQKNVDIQPLQQQKLPVLFNFSEEYYKLNDPIFTTIRSTNYGLKHSLYMNAKGWITVKGRKVFIVKVVGWKDMSICDMPIELLKKDVAYPNFSIQTHEEFVYGLNQILLRAGYPYANNSKTTVKRIYRLEKIGGRPEKW
jgi:hypothetical protein